MELCVIVRNHIGSTTVFLFAGYLENTADFVSGDHELQMWLNYKCVFRLYRHIYMLIMKRKLQNSVFPQSLVWVSRHKNKEITSIDLFL